MLTRVLVLVLGCTPLLSQGSEHLPPRGLTVVMVDVGQGDGIVVRAPDGTIHVVDAGPEGAGLAAVLPAIDSLQPTAYGYTFLSHFHDDHQGGLDEVLQRPFSIAYDRGDVRRTNTSQATQRYLSAAGTRRRTVGLGQVYDLGGGARLRCIAVDGFVVGGGGLDPSGSAQEENSRSIVLRLDYGDFSMWLGGDLTGGGNGTANIEGPASLACGDVDVYKVNHHGSNTSTSLELISRIDPELAIVSAGRGNSFGHPTPTIVNRLVQAAALRTLLCTTSGSSNVIGFAAVGDIRIDTDGFRYRVSAPNGDFLDFLVDEHVAQAPLAGALKISEIQRQPTRVPDTNGEYFEVQAIGAQPLALRGLRLSDDGASVLLRSNLMLLPGHPLCFQRDGNAGRNGGLPLGVTLPFGSIDLGDVADTLTLRQDATLVDQVAYWSGFAGGPGAAAERRDLLGPSVASNFAAASISYGAGDAGSPGRRNSQDITVHQVMVHAETAPGRLVLRGTALGEGGNLSVLAVAYGANQGFPFLGAHIPLNFDPLLQLFLAYPGSSAMMPAEGYRSLTVPFPQPNPAAGLHAVAAHVVLDLGVFGVAGFSSPFPIVFQ